MDIQIFIKFINKLIKNSNKRQYKENEQYKLFESLTRWHYTCWNIYTIIVDQDKLNDQDKPFGVGLVDDDGMTSLDDGDGETLATVKIKPTEMWIQLKN